MSPFDTFVVVDWSGGNDTGPTPRKDAIWAGVSRGHLGPACLSAQPVRGRGLDRRVDRSRAGAGSTSVHRLRFPFAYPSGFAEALTGSEDPFALWEWFEARVEDAPDCNNRFDLVAEINLGLGDGSGPFWANGLPNRDIAGLPRTKAGYANPFPDKRAAEQRAKGSFTCWQMAGAGAVGSQMVMGLPVLSRLRARFADHVAVWPFERPDAQVVFTEIWPSLTVGPAPDNRVKDAWQVQELARQLAAVPPVDLAQMLDGEAAEEGWMFGLGFEHLLKAPPPAQRLFCPAAGRALDAGGRGAGAVAGTAASGDPCRRRAFGCHLGAHRRGGCAGAPRQSAAAQYGC